ncbi:MAG TPA: tetratricopeptide repeat protein, partial [Pyrinomonadaceae bacterium]|nr:tetratricopeptide repeat protein [Pyrinomonadaceae bacterium]
MSFYENLRVGSVSVLTVFLLAAGFLLVLSTMSCSALVAETSEDEISEGQMSEKQALQSLRQMTKDGRFPPEAAVLQIENRFANTRTGALAKLLRARIRFETNDFDGAAQILASSIFREKTTVADYALWLRGKALLQTGKQAEAINVFAELVRDFPDSLRAREIKLLWANSMMQSGQADKIPAFLKDSIDKNDGDALLLTAKSFESQNNPVQAVAFYRRAYFYAAGTAASKEAETKLTAPGQSLAPQTAEEI